MWRFLAPVLLLLLPAALALTLVDVQSGDEIENGFVRIEGGGTTEFLLTPEYAGPEVAPVGLLLLRTGAAGTFNYYAHLAGGESSVIVHPAGLLIGSVIDRYDSRIIHTPLTVDCLTEQLTLETDATGTFRAVLPAELCLLAIVSQQRTGTAAVSIKQGELSEVTVLVAASEKEDSFWLIGIAALVALGAGGFILWHTTKKNLAERAVPSAVRTVLKDKERLIVETLELRSGKMTLRELRFTLQLPRTSLLRTLIGLEQRGIVLRKEEHGRLTVELVKR